MLTLLALICVYRGACSHEYYKVNIIDKVIKHNDTDSLWGLCLIQLLEMGSFTR